MGLAVEALGIFDFQKRLAQYPARFGRVLQTRGPEGGGQAVGRVIAPDREVHRSGQCFDCTIVFVGICRINAMAQQDRPAI